RLLPGVAPPVSPGGRGGPGFGRLPRGGLEGDVDEPFGAAGIAVQPVRYVLVVGVPGKPWQPDNADGGGRAVQGLCRSEGFLLAGPVGIREDQDIPPGEGFDAVSGPFAACDSRCAVIERRNAIYVLLAFANEDASIGIFQQVL